MVNSCTDLPCLDGDQFPDFSGDEAEESGDSGESEEDSGLFMVERPRCGHGTTSSHIAYMSG